MYEKCSSKLRIWVEMSKNAGAGIAFFTKILNFAVEKSNGCRKEA